MTGITDHLERLAQLTAAISAAPTPDELARVSAEGVCAVIGAGWAAVYLCADEAIPAQVESLGIVGPVPEGLSLERLTAVLDGDARSLRLDSASFAARADWAHEHSEKGILRAWLCVPLPGNPPPGYIALSHPAGSEFTRNDELLTAHIAHLAALKLRTLRLESEVRSVVASREAFLRVVIHELKNPITSLRGFTQLTLRRFSKNGEIDPTSVGEALQSIFRQTERLTGVISDIREAAHIYAGRLTLERSIIDVGGLLASAVSDLQMTAPERAIHIGSPANCPAPVDPVRMRQAILYLLENAAQSATAPSPVEVVIRLDNSQCVVITIRHRGNNVPLEEWQRALGYLRRSDAIPLFEGVSIGLYIAYRIIEQHEGHLTVEQTPDGVTQFVITLPGEHR